MRKVVETAQVTLVIHESRGNYCGDFFWEVKFADSALVAGGYSQDRSSARAKATLVAIGSLADGVRWDERFGEELASDKEG